MQLVFKREPDEQGMRAHLRVGKMRDLNRRDRLAQLNYSSHVVEAVMRAQLASASAAPTPAVNDVATLLSAVI